MLKIEKKNITININYLKNVMGIIVAHLIRFNLNQFTIPFLLSFLAPPLVAVRFYFPFFPAFKVWPNPVFLPIKDVGNVEDWSFSMLSSILETSGDFFYFDCAAVLINFDDDLLVYSLFSLL